MTILIIVESPSKCKKIESFLGTNYKCISSYGHFRNLTGLKDITISNDKFHIDYELDNAKLKNIKLMEKEIKKASKILLATDDDREGEAIAWHICDHFNLPLTTPRIIFHEITKNAIIKAVENPGAMNMNMVYAQQTRQVLDLLVGYKISPCLWTHISRNQGLSAGRCQTPALHLIYENQKKIESQEPEKVFLLHGLFTSKNILFQCNHSMTTKEEILGFMIKSQTYKYTIHCGATKQVKKVPPNPFITSSLQQYASSYAHCSPKETMSLCQKLYEAGYITYMRTDCPKYSKEFVDDGLEYIDKTYGMEYKRTLLNTISLQENKTNDNTLAQEAHEAIRPTNISCEKIDEKFTIKEKKMYQIIRNRSLMTLMANAHYESYVAKIDAPDKAYYSQTFQHLVFDGWQKIETSESNPYFHYVQTLMSDVTNNKLIAKETIHNIVSHINEAQMVQLLEKKGIGRPSTFSSIIDKIQTRGYVKKENIVGKKYEINEIVMEKNKIKEKMHNVEYGNEKNKLLLSPLGKSVIEFLYTYFDEIFNEQFTYEMESNLDKIKNGDSSHILCSNDYDILIKNMLKTQNEKLPKKESHSVNEKYDYVLTKYGPCLTYKENDKTHFINLKPQTDYEICLRNIDNLESLFGEKHKSRNLGNYLELPVELKNGKFGAYISYNNTKIGLKHLDKTYDDIHMGDIIDLLGSNETGDKPSNPNIVRIVNDEISIRKSKFGNYIFYQTEKMKKPKFIKLKGFHENISTCSEGSIKKFAENAL